MVNNHGFFEHMGGNGYFHQEKILTIYGTCYAWEEEKDKVRVKDKKAKKLWSDDG